MKIKQLCLITAVPFLWCSSLAQAGDINWSGYMSIGAGKTTNSGGTYLVEPTTGGTYDNDLRLAPESVVGIQAQAIITDQLRGTVQMVSKGGSDFNTSVDWAYLSYDLTDSITANAGRFRLPLYYYSDFLDVGYAYHWIRPPVELYSAFTAVLEGVSLYHSTMIGDFEVATQVWHGNILTEQDTDEGLFVFDTQKNQGINTLVTWDWLKLRLLYNTTDIGMASADFGNTDSAVTFLSAAIMADYGNFLWRSEITQAGNKTAYPASEYGPAGVAKTKDVTWYASLGYTVGDFTPHFTHAEVDPDALSFLSASTTTDTLGVSWAFHPSAALKLEYLEREQESAFMPLTKTSVFATSIDILF